MKAVDTNVLARFILNDDEEQAAIAAELLAAPTWVAATIWLELGWVLGKRAGLDRISVADALDLLLRSATIHTIDREGLLWAVARYRDGADWADMVHLVAIGGTADSFATFDRAIARDAKGSPVPIETLG